jgi:restriction system protein
VTKPIWMIRAGEGATELDAFLEDSCVAVGWDELGRIEPGVSRQQIADRVSSNWPNYKKGKVAIVAGQLYRFLNEIKVGDSAMTYDPARRVYHLGEVIGEPEYAPARDFLHRVRKVRWQSEISRDDVSVPTRNSLGAISTLFLLPEAAATEVRNLASGVQAPPEEETEEASLEASLDAIRNQARELIKDKINSLDPYELQDLVAGLLRAMGYKTRVSPPGADRGVDIMASPDGFGFEQPRIIVECKHRTRTQMGAQDIRTFLGGRHKDDKGLYVSTGGFSKDARYEADRASIPLTLMNLDQLVDAVLEQYGNMDDDSRVLLPLTQVFWPAG